MPSPNISIYDTGPPTRNFSHAEFLRSRFIHQSTHKRELKTWLRTKRIYGLDVTVEDFSGLVICMSMVQTCKTYRKWTVL